MNEQDVLPIRFTRIMAKEAGLVRAYKGRLVATKRATDLLQPEQAPQLFKIVFETVFWRMNLAYLDRMPGEHWPQNHIGLVLWCLSVVAHEWDTPDDLMSTCTMPDGELGAAARDFPEFAMVTRVLRPLTWFGLMEASNIDTDRAPLWRRDRQYRKTPLYDRVLSFVVALRKLDTPVQ